MMFSSIRIAPLNLNSSLGPHPFTETEERRQADHPLVLCKTGTNKLIPGTSCHNTSHKCLGWKVRVTSLCRWQKARGGNGVLTVVKWHIIFEFLAHSWYVWISCILILNKWMNERISKWINEWKDAKMCIFMHCCNSTRYWLLSFPRIPLPCSWAALVNSLLMYSTSSPCHSRKQRPQQWLLHSSCWYRWGNVGAIHPSFKIHGKETEGEA